MKCKCSRVSVYIVDQSHFAELVTQAIKSLPKQYREHLDNVAFFVEREPNVDQRAKMSLRECDLLLGLYEGIPLTERASNYTFVLPDTITIFQDAIQSVVTSEQELWEQIRRTVWHEVAHYYGLDHDRIRAIEKRL